MRKESKKIILAICFLLAATIVNIQAQTGEKRIERLSDLARIWGAVKYFHPTPAYREIDWDKALIETIPKVNAAKSAEEYAQALNSMLAFLGDKTTRARVGGDAMKTENKNAAATENKEPILIENGVLTIDALTVANLFQREANRRSELINKTSSLFSQAKAVLIDLRGERENSDYYLNLYLQAVLPPMLDRDVALGAIRYRFHNGYVPQYDSTSGGYYSALMTRTPETLAGMNKAKTPPIVFLIGAENAPATEMLSGLQSAKLAFVVQDGDAAGESGAITTTFKLPEAIEVRMRTAELVNADGGINFAADLIAAKGEAMKTARQIIAENKFVSNRAKTVSAFAPQVGQKEKNYAEMEFPAKEYRMLALFRFWNVINYFFPYKNLTGTDWNTILPKYIPKFEANQNAAEYQMTVREMATELHDSHGFVDNTNALDEKIGRFVPAVLLRNIENQTVIFKVLDEKLPLKPGDVVLSVDGETIEKRRDFFSRIYAASTPQALMRNVHLNLLRGQKDTPAKLTVRGADQKIRSVEIPRVFDFLDDNYFNSEKRTTPVVSMLPGGFAYVDLDRLQKGEVDKMFETVKNAPAVIFDMRGYPSGTAWAIAPRLTTKKRPVAVLFAQPTLEAVNFEDGELFTPDYAFGQPIPAAEGEVYTGKVVMLINEYAQSQAEGTALFFEAARPDITFIGTPTAGANGDVTTLVLPGNLSVSFSGDSVRHADGRQLQRVGIQPTINVTPTIKGIIEGRDEVLDATIKFLQKK